MHDLTSLNHSLLARVRFGPLIPHRETIRPGRVVGESYRCAAVVELEATQKLYPKPRSERELAR